MFYAITGIATAWFYPRLAMRGLGNALVIGGLPLAGSAVLLYIAARSPLDLDSGSLWGSP